MRELRRTKERREKQLRKLKREEEMRKRRLRKSQEEKKKMMLRLLREMRQNEQEEREEMGVEDTLSKRARLAEDPLCMYIFKSRALLRLYSGNALLENKNIDFSFNTMFYEAMYWSTRECVQISMAEDDDDRQTCSGFDKAIGSNESYVQ